MTNTNEKEENTAPGADRDYMDIIKDDINVEKQFTEENGTPAKIVYYCQECEKVITPKRIGKKLAFSCNECKGSKVAFGSENSIQNHYNHINKQKTQVKPE